MFFGIARRSARRRQRGQAGMACPRGTRPRQAVSVASAALKVALGRIAWLTSSRFGR